MKPIRFATADSVKGVEDEGEIKWRKDFLRQIGYKL